MSRHEIIRGDSERVGLIVTDNLTDLPWSPPLGVSIRATGKTDRKHTDAQAVFSKTLISGITIETNAVVDGYDDPQTVVWITIDPEDTDSLATNGNTQTVYCDAQATWNSGDSVRSWPFLLVVSPDVSRTTP